MMDYPKAHRYVLTYFNGVVNRDDRVHMFAWTAEDAITQFKLNANRSTPQAFLQCIEPYDEKRHGLWQGGS